MAYEEEPRRVPPEGRHGRERVRPLNPMEEEWTAAGPIRPVPEEDVIHRLELTAQATVADAAPLGLAAFAATTFTLGAIEAGWTTITAPGGAGIAFLSTIAGTIIILPMLIVFGGIAQFIAAMWAFRKGSTFWATFLGTFGSLYAVIGLAILVAGTTGISLGVTSPQVGTGVAVAMFALIAAYLTLAATGVSTIVVGVLALLTVSLALLTVAFFIGGQFIIIVAAGYAAIVSALLAFYASAALVVNSTLGREVMPY